VLGYLITLPPRPNTRQSLEDTREDPQSAVDSCTRAGQTDEQSLEIPAFYTRLFDSNMGSWASCLGCDVEVWHVLEVEDAFSVETVLSVDDDSPENLPKGLRTYC